MSTNTILSVAEIFLIGLFERKHEDGKRSVKGFNHYSQNAPFRCEWSHSTGQFGLDASKFEDMQTETVSGHCC